MKISRQKGTKDIFGKDIKIWQLIEKEIRNICNSYCFEEIRTPVFEATELYARGVGDGTDIVNKEMYTFLDKGGRSITLRPELTAGVVRAYIEDGMSSMTTPVKLWYEANMYRYEKMQKGRYREFSQFGVELFGSNSCLADVEVMMLAYELLERLGVLNDITLCINSIGCEKCRKDYIVKLKKYLENNLSNMCDTCNVRFKKNPLRILDCKEKGCQEILKNAPMITDYLCEECRNDFEKVKNILDNLNVKYVVDKKIVRGLDYYNKLVFEFISNEYGFAICAGGRYDKLIENLGGNYTPAVGFGMGMERLVLLLEERLSEKMNKNSIDIFFALMDEKYITNVRPVIKELRNFGKSVEFDLNERSFKAKLKYASKINAKYSCIIGENELANNMCIFKNMESGEQKQVKLDAENILDEINC